MHDLCVILRTPNRPSRNLRFVRQVLDGPFFETRTRICMALATEAVRYGSPSVGMPLGSMDIAIEYEQPISKDDVGEAVHWIKRTLAEYNFHLGSGM